MCGSEAGGGEYDRVGVQGMSAFEQNAISNSCTSYPACARTSHDLFRSKVTSQLLDDFLHPVSRREERGRCLSCCHGSVSLCLSSLEATNHTAVFQLELA